MSVTLAFIGDIMLGRMVDAMLASRSPESVWGSALPILRKADAVFGNLECAISDRGIAQRRIRKAFTFRARPAAVDVLRAAGVRCVSLANNHVLDFGDEALLDTLMHLDAAGIAHAGAGRTLADAQTPAVVAAAGLRIGFIAITDNEPSFAASPDRPGTFYLTIGGSAAIPGTLRRLVDELRRDGVSTIVLSAHWGPNLTDGPSAEFRHFAHAMLDFGIDIVHGHSAHVFHGVEPHGNGLIMYDTGDIIDDCAVDPRLRNDWSFLFLVDVEAGTLARLRMLPVRLTVARVDLASGDEAAAIQSCMIARCKALGVHPEVTAEGLALPLGSPASRTPPARRT